GDPTGDRSTLPNPGEEVVRGGGVDHCGQCIPGGVQGLPQLRGQRLPGPPGVLPGSNEGPGAGAGRGLVVGQNLQHIPAGEDDVGVRVGYAHHCQQRPTGGVLIDPGVLQQALQVRIENPSGVIGTFNVAPDPEQGLGDAAEHQASPSPVCCCCSVWALSSASVGLASRLTPPGWASAAASGSWVAGWWTRRWR